MHTDPWRNRTRANGESARLALLSKDDGIRFEERTTRKRKVISTTLGELIVAVTDEVMPLVHDSSDLYRVTSWIVNDLLAHWIFQPHRSRRRG